jgi:hypothetical protein
MEVYLTVVANNHGDCCIMFQGTVLLDDKLTDAFAESELFFKHVREHGYEKAWELQFRHFLRHVADMACCCPVEIRASYYAYSDAFYLKLNESWWHDVDDYDEKMAKDTNFSTYFVDLLFTFGTWLKANKDTVCTYSKEIEATVSMVVTSGDYDQYLDCR